MLKFLVNYQVCSWHIVFGNFLLLLQTDGMTHNTVNDIHLKQAEPWFRPQYISTCFLSETVFTEQGEKKTPASLMKLLGPVAWCQNSRRWLHQYLSYRSTECFLVEHCSSSLNRLPWIPGAWPHYNFHT